MSRTIQIGDRPVGREHPPFIIAEMSGNHNQSLDRALQIVDAAAEAGAHALKLQTYTADTMTLQLKEGDFFISNPKSLWYGRSLYDLYQEAHTPWEWHKPIFDRCREHGMLFVSTPFDATAVDFLVECELPFFKIASFENTDLPLIRRVAATGKPMIISCGMATVGEGDLIVEYPNPPAVPVMRKPKIIKTNVEKSVVRIIDGRAVRGVEQVEVLEQEFVEMPVFNSDGKPSMIEVRRAVVDELGNVVEPAQFAQEIYRQPVFEEAA